MGDQGYVRTFLHSLWGGEVEINWLYINSFYGAMAVLCVALKTLGDTYPVFAGWWIVLSPFVPCAIFTLSMLFIKLITTVDDSMLKADAQSEKMMKFTGRKTGSKKLRHFSCLIHIPRTMR